MNINLKNIDTDVTGISITSAEDTYKTMKRIIEEDETIDTNQEHFWTIALDKDRKVLSIELIAVGSATRVVVPTTEVLRVAISEQAVGIILVHNHPSGSLEPSYGDKNMTNRLMQVSLMLNIEILDHVIITDNSFFSFRSN